MAGTVTASVIKNDTTSPPQFQNSAGTEIGTLCRAWVRFTGSSGSINGSFNVSSVTRNATGSYTVNFTNAMPDANYSAVATPKRISGNGNNGIAASVTYNGTIATTSVPISCCQFGSTNEDPDVCSVSIFR